MDKQSRFTRFYPTRIHSRGPGIWGLCDMNQPGMVMETFGKLQAYLMADMLNAHGVPEDYNSAFPLMFQRMVG